MTHTDFKFLALQILIITCIPVIFDPVAEFSRINSSNSTATTPIVGNSEILSSSTSRKAAVKARMATRINISTNPSRFVKTLAGIQMPKLIYGTAWKKGQTADLVVEAVRAGFRGIDTACQPKHYHEPGVGEALKLLIEQDGMAREDLFIQTKFTSLDGQDPNNIPYDKKAPLVSQVKQSLEVSLRNLGTNYIDSLVMHSPMRSMDQTLEVWKTFESFVDDGKVRQLGISNCYALKSFQTIYDSARIKPAVLQNRLYEDSNFDKEIRQFCKEKGIYYQSFWTLTANPQILGSRDVVSMSKKYEKTPAQMFFAYLTQTDVITPLTGTKNRKHMEEDLQVLDMKPLTAEEKKIFDDFIN